MNASKARRRTSDRIADAIESAQWLDPPGEIVADGVGRVAPPELRNVLAGAWLGHPLHPALVGIPVGCWASGIVLDLVGDPDGARRLIGLGCLGAIPAVASGLSDWLDTAEAERRVGVLHAAGNLIALTCFASSWRARRRGRPGARVLGLLGLVAASASGWLGGHLAYVMGVGVDTNAFQSGPSDWAELDRPAGPTPQRQEVDGVGIVVVQTDSGVAALADRCSHRGGPLSQGVVRGGCIECPWHGSQFDLASGAVRRGPASIPQPCYEVRSDGGRLAVRRRERRALRQNPV